MRVRDIEQQLHRRWANKSKPVDKIKTQMIAADEEAAMRITWDIDSSPPAALVRLPAVDGDALSVDAIGGGKMLTLGRVAICVHDVVPDTDIAGLTVLLPGRNSGRRVLAEYDADGLPD
jgi:hypothetical protein